LSATSTSHSTSSAVSARPTRTIHGDVELAGGGTGVEAAKTVGAHGGNMITAISKVGAALRTTDMR